MMEVFRPGSRWNARFSDRRNAHGKTINTISCETKPENLLPQLDNVRDGKGVSRNSSARTLHVMLRRKLSSARLSLFGALWGSPIITKISYVTIAWDTCTCRPSPAQQATIEVLSSHCCRTLPKLAHGPEPELFRVHQEPQM